ncbi:MAG: hypothetical protein M3461_17370 [Pseudomonadota bacterium]|nr:hypothetical protein [Pseudomonadota bacterium]
MSLRATSWFFWLVLGANAASALEVELAYIGDPADAVYSALSQGLEEANLQGQFLGQRYRLTRFAPGEPNRAPSSQAAVLLAALEDRELLELGERAPGRAVFNLGSGSDALRQRCLPNLLHILPSTRMKADALAQWQRLHPEFPSPSAGLAPGLYEICRRAVESALPQGTGTGHGRPGLGRLGRGQDGRRLRGAPR